MTKAEEGGVSMSTREMAYSILDQLTESELQGFIALFSRTFQPKDDDIWRRREAFEKMEKLCRYTRSG